MFELNKTEVKILENIIQKDEFDSNFNFIGLTTYQMQKGKDNIPSANWAKYKDKLLYFQLVSENYQEKLKPRKPRKSKSKINYTKKFKIRYYVTPIGFFTLLQNLKSDQISCYITNDYLKFLPLISEHLSILKKLDVVFYELFKYSIEHIELKPVGTDEIKKGEKLKSIFNRQIEEKVILSFINEQTEMVFSRTFHTFSEPEKVIVNHLTKHVDLQNHDELINSVSSHLTFLFYFYLMLSQKDILLLDTICTNATLNDSKIQSAKFIEKIPKNEYEQFINQIGKLEKKILPKLKSITKKIKKDPEIIDLFDSNITEIESKLLSVDFLEYLSKTMTR